MELDRHRPTILRCARSSSTSRAGPRSRRYPSPTAPASSSACSPAGSADPTSRRSAPRPQAPCWATRWSRRRPAGASRSSTTCPAASATAAWPGTSRPARRSARPRSSRAASPSVFAPTRRCQLPDGIDDATATYVEPLACVLRAARTAAARPGARGRERLRREAVRRGSPARAATTSSRSTATRGATDAHPDGPVDAAVLCAPGGGDRGGRGAGSGRHAARLRPLRTARAATPSTAGELTVLGVAVGHAAPHARGDLRSSPTSTCPSRPSCRSSASTRGSSSTAAARP